MSLRDDAKFTKMSAQELFESWKEVARPDAVELCKECVDAVVEVVR